MTVIADRYELLEPLGQGGMASVHVARDRVLERRVALKLLREDIGGDAVLRERFLREARMSAQLSHGAIVRVYDAGVDGRTPWMAMELVEGESLRDAMSRTGPMPVERVVTLVGEVLGGLAAAHAAGVVHRDVKPANVLLSRDGAKLGDFGIAKSLAAVGADLTQANQFMGTPKYIAPEVAIGSAASPRSDIYATAVMTWEMLAGVAPFEHDNPLTLAMMHRTDPVPPLAERRPDLPVALVAAVEAALAKDPAQRPPDAEAFAALLRAGARGDARSVAAGTAATQALSRPADPTGGADAAGLAGAAGLTGAAAAATAPVQRERTVALPVPGPVGPPRAPGSPGARPGPAAAGRVARPRASGGRGGWGVAVVVVLLLALAAAAFAVASEQVDDPASTPSAVPGTTDPPTTPAPPPAAPATTAPPAAPPPAPAPLPAPTVPEPTAEPTPTTPPEPTAAPTTPPTTAPPTAPEPTPEPGVLLPLDPSGR